MGVGSLLDLVTPFINLVKSSFDCFNGFLLPIMGIFTISITMGVASYILHRL